MFLYQHVQNINLNRFLLQVYKILWSHFEKIKSWKSSWFHLQSNNIFCISSMQDCFHRKYISISQSFIFKNWAQQNFDKIWWFYKLGGKAVASGAEDGTEKDRNWTCKFQRRGHRTFHCWIENEKRFCLSSYYTGTSSVPSVRFQATKR